jgi:hypothetical protein
MFQLPAVMPFSVPSEYTTLGQRWVKSLEYYWAAANITDSARKRAVLLDLVGPEVQDIIFLTFTDTGDTYEMAMTKLTEYFAPRKHIPFERHLFRETTQESGESIESFVTRLRTLAKSCSFENLEEAIRDEVVEKCSSGKLRRRLLREPELTLANCIQISKHFQVSERQASQMEMLMLSSASHSEDAASTVDAYSLQSTCSSCDLGQPRGNAVGLTCFCCGLLGHKAKDPSCPANGKSCNKCGKPGHFGRVCKSSTKANGPQSRSLNVHFMAPRVDNESSDEYLSTLGNSSRKLQESVIKLSLLRVGPPTIYTAVNCVSPQSLVDRILSSNHSKVFQGSGKLIDYQLVIHTDANVMPVGGHSS